MNGSIKWISRKYKNVEDIGDDFNLIKNLFNFVDKNKIKEIYGLEEKVDNLTGLIFMLKKKFDLKYYQLGIKIILQDLISGKIGYEVNY